MLHISCLYLQYQMLYKLYKVKGMDVGQVTWVDHIEESIGGVLNLDFSKANCLGRKLNVITLCLSFADYLKFVACMRSNSKFSVGENSGYLRGIDDSYFCPKTWSQVAALVIHLDWSIHSIIWNFLNGVWSWHKRVILENELSWYSLAHEQRPKVYALLV